MLQKSPPHADVWGVKNPLQAWTNWPARSITPAVEAMVTWNGKWSSNLSDLNEEYAAFLKRRLKADVAFVERSTACKRPDEVWGVCSDFALRAAHDYQREFSEFAKIWTKMVADGFAAFETYSKSAGHPGAN